MDSPFGRKAQQPAHYSGNALPIMDLSGELLLAGARDRVELGLAVILRTSPPGRYPALLLQPEQRSIDSTLIDGQEVVADLLDAAGDAVAVLRPQSLEGLEDHQIECAL